jgi:hypothetical protein
VIRKKHLESATLVRAILLQVETLPVKYSPPNRCPGKKDKGVRVVVLQQRHSLPYVVHPVSVLEQGRHCLSNTLHQINVLEKRQARVEVFSRDIVFRMLSKHVSILEQGSQSNSSSSLLHTLHKINVLEKRTRE